MSYTCNRCNCVMELLQACEYKGDLYCAACANTLILMDEKQERERNKIKGFHEDYDNYDSIYNHLSRIGDELERININLAKLINKK